MNERERRETERKAREGEIADIVREALDAVVAKWPPDAPALKEYFPFRFRLHRAAARLRLVFLPDGR